MKSCSRFNWRVLQTSLLPTYPTRKLGRKRQVMPGKALTQITVRVEKRLSTRNLGKIEALTARIQVRVRMNARVDELCGAFRKDNEVLWVKFCFYFIAANRFTFLLLFIYFFYKPKNNNYRYSWGFGVLGFWDGHNYGPSIIMCPP